MVFMMILPDKLCPRDLQGIIRYESLQLIDLVDACPTSKKQTLTLLPEMDEHEIFYSSFQGSWIVTRLPVIRLLISRRQYGPNSSEETFSKITPSPYVSYSWHDLEKQQ